MGETYNIGGSSERTNIEVVRTICNLLDELSPRSDGNEHSSLITFVADRPGHDHRYAIDATAKRYLLLKSRVHWRAGFQPIAKAVVECAGVGVCTSDYGMLDFRRVRRPIYPLDRINAP